MSEKPRYFQMLIPFAVVLIITSMFILVFYWVQSRQKVDLKQESFKERYPLPNWVIQVDPKPGESIEMAMAVYGNDDIYWPSAGNVCIQFDNSIIGITKEDWISEVKIYINNFRVYLIGSGNLFHGLVPKKGTILINDAPSEDRRVNHCLAMKLPDGIHLVSIEIPERDLSYSWAFELSKNAK